MKSRIIAGAFAVVAVLGISVTAQASTHSVPQTKAAYTVPADSVNTAAIQTGAVDTFKIKDKSIGGWDVLDNTLPWSKMGSDFRANINKTINTSNTAKSTADQALAKANEALAKPDQNTPDVKGDAQHVAPVPPKVITNLGGKYFGDTTSPDDDRYTKLGEIVVPAGSWMVYSTVQFTRTADGAAGSRPQVGLRIGQDQTKDGDAKWGVSVGTIGGNDIAPYKGADLFGSTSEPLVTTQNTTVEIYGFGYNDDRGTAGSGEIAAAVKVTLVRA